MCYKVLKKLEIININSIQTKMKKPSCYFGFRRTRITESPRRNILLMKRSLFTGCARFPLPDFGISVQNSLTFSNIMLQCLSNALTLPNNFLLFRQLIKTCELVFTAVVRTDRGPVRKSSSSRFSSSSTDIFCGPDACIVPNLISTANF